ncbi:hypothetical protein FB567DRAFT_580616 [Paraphoma chrysanthemicola]|uniref:Uncharacterized protein n=1 Tax=Paraphoma chrysanthemicola TaxID=798071 RepID=A0A8K0R4P0_9PLEO|nr:hypothetical protein FB567DRAFT_580616 [Paraphoma chrysanthemicola]
MAQPLYTPISFVSPISDTTRRHSAHTTTPLRRLSTYLKNAVTLEDTSSAVRRESIISDLVGAEQESVRRASIASAQDRRQDLALQEARRASVGAFWERYGSVGEDGRRGSLIGGEGERRGSVAGGSERALLGARRWRRINRSFCGEIEVDCVGGTVGAGREIVTKLSIGVQIGKGFTIETA